MLDANSGEILLDGVNISDVTKESVRRRVAVVPQDTCLFDETVGYKLIVAVDKILLRNPNYITAS